MSSGIYDQFRYDLMVKAVNLTSDTIKVALMNDSHTFDATDSTWTDVSANQITGTGYTAGGQALIGKTVTKATTTYWDATDLSWTGFTGSVYHAVIYDTSNSNNLICSLDFGGVRTLAYGTFTIIFGANGIISLT